MFRYGARHPWCRFLLKLVVERFIIFNMAMIQMSIEGGKKTYNLKHAENMIKEAAQT
jgi:hypothetical protein